MKNILTVTCSPWSSDSRDIKLEHFFEYYWQILPPARLKTLTAFFSKQWKWKLSRTCTEPFNCAMWLCNHYCDSWRSAWILLSPVQLHLAQFLSSPTTAVCGGWRWCVYWICEVWMVVRHTCTLVGLSIHCMALWWCLFSRKLSLCLSQCWCT